MLSSVLLKTRGFKHGFSTRSTSLEEISAACGVAPDDLKRVKQVHSARVLEVDAEWTDGHEADALVSRARFAVGIRTADCVPVLIADEASGAVAAVHAGWRGVEGRIVENAITTLGGDPSRFVAAIGPCIMVCSFETGADVAEKIATASDTSVIASRHTGADGEAKAMVDLRKAVRVQLERAGLASTNVDDVAHCTFCEPALFFSYRRDQANVAERAGRMISAIAPR
ncbi:MAG TPA: peptidoglycan editing factor PgeF [Polyangiaceae bacterium]